MTTKHYLESEFETLMTDPATIDFLDGGALDGIWFWDLENPEHEWMSPGFWHALGFDPSKRAHLAAEWQDLIYPEDGALALENVTRHLSDPNYPYDQLVRYHTADDETITVRCRGKAIRVDGKPTRMLGVHTIVDDTRETRSNNELYNLLELSGDAILGWSTDRGIERWNVGAEQVYGVPRAIAMGQNPNELTQAVYDKGWGHVEAQLSAGHQWQGEVHRTDAKGRKIVTSTRLQRHTVGKTRTFYLQIDRDITTVHAIQMRQTLIHDELNHRIKNMFAVISALIRLSARTETNAKVLSEKVGSRIAALAAAYAVSVSEDADIASDLKTTLEVLIAPYVPDPDQIRLRGPACKLPPNLVTPFGLIVNELATNAAKHGALAGLDGRLDVAWNLAADEMLTLTWHETLARDPLSPPVLVSSGFGSQLVDLSASQMSAQFRREWRDDGLTFTLSLPLQAPTA